MARNPRHEIMLVVTGQGIMAHWMTSGKPDAEIVGLFGTHIIPTPYLTARMMPEAVKEISAKNPGYTVSCV